ncbi:MAG: alanine racemase [Elainellaceae cyanobacterium]
MLSWDHRPTLSTMGRERAWVEINHSHLAHNVQAIQALLAPGTDLMAVVKADAYGHGAVTIAQTALQAGATWLGVATIPEGIELREAGIQAPILLLGATNTIEQVRAIAHWQLQPTLCTEKQALVFAEVMDSATQPLPVHINVDTGMSRLGVPWQQALPLAQHIQRSPHLHLASLYSHFATADDSDLQTLHCQRDRFQQVIQTLGDHGIVPPMLHLANSAGTLVESSLHYNLVRVGLAIYGLYPAPHFRASIDLKPVLQVKARVTQVKTLPLHTGVSYGHRFVTQRETRLAVVGIGYADGVPRLLSNRMNVLLRGQVVPQIGAITMDQLMLDVTDLAEVHEGDVVTLLGQDQDASISADNWADTLGTISWEILCGFKHRLPRLSLSSPATATANPLTLS